MIYKDAIESGIRRWRANGPFPSRDEIEPAAGRRLDRRAVDGLYAMVIADRIYDAVQLHSQACDAPDEAVARACNEFLLSEARLRYGGGG